MTDLSSAAQNPLESSTRMSWAKTVLTSIILIFLIIHFLHLLIECIEIESLFLTVIFRRGRS